MSHPAKETLLAWVDEELDGVGAGAVARHVADCVGCATVAERLRETTRHFAGVLTGLDALEPVAWRAPAAERAAPDVIRLEDRIAARRKAPAVPVAPQRRGGAGLLRWAAGIVLVAGGASAALIGGQRLFGPDAEPTADVRTMAAPAAVDDAAAVGVQPRDGAVRVAVTSAAAGSRLEVAIEDRADARVTVMGVTVPHFRAADGSIDADLQAGVATIRVTLPRTVRGTVTVDGRTVVSVANGVVTRTLEEAGGVQVHVQATPRMN